jgi:hypothetical protein
MQLKSGVRAKKASALRLLGKNWVVQSMLALAVLTPLMVPPATFATRSQTANTTPGADVSNIAAVAAAEAPRPGSANASGNGANSSGGSNSATGSSSTGSGTTGRNSSNNNSGNSANADPYSPTAEPPEMSSDKGFSTEDFLHPDDGSKKPKKAVVTFAPLARPQRTNDFNVVVRVNVPQNTDAVDRLVAYPYPMPVPIPKKPPGSKGAKSNAPPPAPAAGAGGAAAPPPPPPEVKPAVPEQAYDKMPNSRSSIRGLIMNTGYTNRQKRNMAYPQGGWRWQMAYRNALARCHRAEPMYIGEMYSFIDAMEPLCKEECQKFDELEEDRQRRYQTAFEEFQINRNDCEYEAVKKGYFPVEFNMSKGYRGVMAAAELKLGPGTWWITGTHKVTGLLYYWQMPIQVTSNQVENVELNWKNALMIQGGW